LSQCNIDSLFAWLWLQPLQTLPYNLTHFCSQSLQHWPECEIRTPWSCSQHITFLWNSGTGVLSYMV